MNKQTLPRLWAFLGIGVAVIVGLGLVLAFLGRESSTPAPTIPPIISPPPDDPVVASVGGHPIRYSFWMEAVLIDQVMSGLTGQPAPAPDETLQQLINEELVLQAFPPEQEPTESQIEAQIATLEQTWGIDDATVTTTLVEAGLDRAALERAMGRLLTVQASLETLQNQGYDTKTWLEEQRASVEIVLNEEFKDVAAPTLLSAQSPIATRVTSPLSAPTIESPVTLPTPAPAPETPAPTPPLALPQVAPDFTLEQAGGGTLTLREQLTQGPVVLVFFQKCG
ncbi:MAG: hypothetical protein SWK90_01830 [Chloroflexota bacterium]|nr:hypothetical protein [Chloroflexota bacterium]